MPAFQSVASTSQIPPGQAIQVQVAGKRIAIFNVGGAFHALEDDCNHRGGPLSQGQLEGQTVTCPWHGAQFDVTSGEPLRAPARIPMRRYAVQVVGEDVQVEV